jgi:hypothetical protein
MIELPHNPAKAIAGAALAALLVAGIVAREQGAKMIGNALPGVVRNADQHSAK